VSGSGNSPGRAAYEAFGEHLGREIARENGVEYEDGPAEGDFAWDAQSDLTHAAWEVAAQAGHTTAWRLVDETRAERDRIAERVADELGESNQLRALVAEIIGAVEALAEGVQPITAADLARWHKRAGLAADVPALRAMQAQLAAEISDEDPPAIATAGTEHLAAQITADRGEAGT
jgi:hypothetical protein